MSGKFATFDLQITRVSSPMVIEMCASLEVGYDWYPVGLLYTQISPRNDHVCCKIDYFVPGDLNRKEEIVD